MTKRSALAASISVSAAYWCALLSASVLDVDRATLAAIITFPGGAAIVAALAGKHRRSALRISYAAAAMLPVAQLLRFEPTLLFSTMSFDADGASVAERSGAMALAALAICLGQIAAMAVLTVIVYRVVTPRDRRSR